MQKISQIHSCIWKLEFHAHFLPQPPEIIKVVLNFLEFTSVCKKSAYDQCLTTNSDQTHPNIFLSTLNFWHQHVKKYGLFDLNSLSLIGQLNEKQLTDFLILCLAKKIIRKMEKYIDDFQWLQLLHMYMQLNLKDNFQSTVQLSYILSSLKSC